MNFQMLMPCPVCGSAISRTAKECPQCVHDDLDGKKARNSSISLYMGIGLLVFSMILFFVFKEPVMEILHHFG